MKNKGVEVIAVFESHQETLLQYAKDTPIPFPVISDHNQELYKLYKVEKSLFKLLKAFTKKKTKSQYKQGKKSYKNDTTMTQNS